MSPCMVELGDLDHKTALLSQYMYHDRKIKHARAADHQ